MRGQKLAMPGERETEQRPGGLFFPSPRRPSQAMEFTTDGNPREADGVFGFTPRNR